jgi:hypothetical protein
VSDFRYFEAPDYYQDGLYYEPAADDPAGVFLAGGISKVEDWQTVAVELLRASGVPMVVFNPRRKDFPANVSADESGWEQVAWEQHHLHLPNTITMMWFAASDPAESTQPIAQFEFGQAMGEGRQFLVGADPDYPRVRDVELMMRWNRPDQQVYSTLEDLVAATALEIGRSSSAPTHLDGEQT